MMVTSSLRGKKPCNFRAKDEGYRFTLPGAKAHGYYEPQGLTVTELAVRYPLFGLQTPLDTPRPASNGCRIIAERLDMRSRQTTAELKDMLLRGKVI